jgi:hypothetical protein
MIFFYSGLGLRRPHSRNAARPVSPNSTPGPTTQVTSKVKNTNRPWNTWPVGESQKKFRSKKRICTPSIRLKLFQVILSLEVWATICNWKCLIIIYYKTCCHVMACKSQVKNIEARETLVTNVHGWLLIASVKWSNGRFNKLH